MSARKPRENPDVPPNSFGPEDFARETDVSRETLARLKAFVALLEEWNARHNLVSKSSLAEVWRRHVWDSAQLLALIPTGAKTVADLGSGAGFPGLVLAMLRPELSVTLFEATRKKSEFLKAAAQRVLARVEVRNERMEQAKPKAFDIVTARACAPLDKLLSYAQLFSGPDTICLFLKGQNVEVELTQARKSWRMKALRHPSLTDSSGSILDVRELRHVGHAKQTKRPG
ncbi:MAG: 16S rRNA (guanine(527)-N(7))-methyltransferase RsmG [Proteobacteria bacterium]|nr:16S rRNA (guanine(527)-N(7))-methyltransferase RsmG [Pseudomonadota bacterium]